MSFLEIFFYFLKYFLLVSNIFKLIPIHFNPDHNLIPAPASRSPLPRCPRGQPRQETKGGAQWPTSPARPRPRPRARPRPARRTVQPDEPEPRPRAEAEPPRRGAGARGPGQAAAGVQPPVRRHVRGPRHLLRQPQHRQEAGPVQRVSEDILRQGRAQDPLLGRAPAGDAQVHGAGLQHDVQQQAQPQPPLRQPQPQAAHAAHQTQDLAPRRQNSPGEVLLQIFLGVAFD